MHVISDELEDNIVSRLSGNRSVLIIVPDVDKPLQANPCSNMSCEEVCVLTENSVKLEARCLCKLCDSEKIVEQGNFLLIWIVTAFLIIAFLILIVCLVIYFRL